MISRAMDTSSFTFRTRRMRYGRSLQQKMGARAEAKGTERGHVLGLSAQSEGMC